MDDLYEEVDALSQAVAESDADDADEAQSFGEMDGTCSECESSLRRRERLTDHENLGGQMMFVAYVECDCSEHVLGTQPVRIGNLPDGWHDD